MGKSNKRTLGMADDYDSDGGFVSYDNAPQSKKAKQDRTPDDRRDTQFWEVVLKYPQLLWFCFDIVC